MYGLLYWDGQVVAAGMSAEVDCDTSRGALGDESTSAGDILGFFSWGKHEVTGFFEVVGKTAA